MADLPNVEWSDEALLERVLHFVLPVMKRNGSVVAWIVDDTGFVKKGTHSVGMVRRYLLRLLHSPLRFVDLSQAAT